MKILFLHLSDIHIRNKDDVNLYHIKKIVDSLNTVGEFNYAFIIVSGDITNDGLYGQYQNAWHLIGNIISKIKREYKMNSVNVLVVPGNHDVDLSKSDLGRQKIEELYKTRKIDNEVYKELEKQKNFLNFANNNYCFQDSNKLLCKRKIDCNGFEIEVNLLNTAIFSTKDEDKGLHYFPPYLIEEIAEPSGADLVISIMHHAPDWFNDSNKNILESVLFQKNSLIFLGHEHIIGTKDISHNNNPNVKVLAGGMLCNKNDWTKSEYFASVFDTDNSQFDLYRFSWNSDEKLYSDGKIDSDILPNKPSSEKHLEPCKEFTKVFYEDEKHSLDDDFTSYFVFPRLQRESTSEKIQSVDFTSEENFIKELMDKKRIIITGDDNSGRTALLKKLFKTLVKSKVVIYCDVDRIINKKTNKIIKSVFEDIYGDNIYDYQRFQQLQKDKCVLIIDNIDRVNTKHFELFLDGIDKDFEYIIFSRKNLLELDILERTKKAMENSNTFYRYTILPFYADKREELIKNIVNIGLKDGEDKEKIVSILAESIKKQRGLFSLNPDFIIQYVQYYCNNIKEISQNDGEVFSKVFEANIVNSVRPHVKAMRVDKLFIVLDKVSYYIHSQKSYPVKFMEIVSIINEYNEKYDSDVIPIEFIRITTMSKILVQCEEKDEYKFCNKNYLAYFIAREINRKYHNDSVDDDLKNILNYSCFGINEDILIFITYITDNQQILRFILSTAMALTNEWIEFNLDESNIPYLDNFQPLEIKTPDQKEKDDAKKDDLERERNIDNNKIDKANIYDYKEVDADKLYNQLVRAISLLSILSKCLPNFEHMMYKEDKAKFVETIYKLPNKIFYMWAMDVDQKKDMIVEFMKELQSQDYYQHKIQTTDEIVKMIQWDSISLLLDLYDITITNSAKDNTKKFLNAFNYNILYTYSLEHLIVIEKYKDISEFIREANILFSKTKNNTIKTMVVRIVRHLLIYSKKISPGESQKLENDFFPSQKVGNKFFSTNGEGQKNEKRRILLLRSKNTNLD